MIRSARSPLTLRLAKFAYLPQSASLRLHLLARHFSLLRRFLTHRYSFSHASRRSYYIDPTTGGTAWGETLRSEGRLPAAAAPPAPAPAAAAVEAPLPPNWSAHYDASSGYYYYNNSVTSATTWERPV